MTRINDTMDTATPRHGAVAFTAAFLAAILGTSAVGGASPPPDIPVYHAQVYVEVCDERKAGTDAAIWAMLSGPVGKPGVGASWNRIDTRGFNDFEPGSSKLYDVALDNVETIGDLRALTIHRYRKSDAVKICALGLLVNGRVLFINRIPNGGVWLDADRKGPGGLPVASTYAITRSQMEASLWWSYFQEPPPPQELHPRWLEGRLSAAVKEAIRDTPFFWNYGVETKARGNNMLSLELTIAYRKRPTSRNKSHAWIDVDFSIGCWNGSTMIRPVHVGWRGPRSAPFAELAPAMRAAMREFAVVNEDLLRRNGVRCTGSGVGSDGAIRTY